jgi:hypothetical protein
MNHEKHSFIHPFIHALIDPYIHENSLSHTHNNSLLVGVGPGHRDEAIGEHIAVRAKHTPWRTIAAASL